MVEVSVVIPTKNDADTLDDCLKSIKNLDFPEEKVEIIIVDGHSDDETVKIAEDYGCRIYYEDRGTISYARQLGIEKAKGKFIAFTDADCVVGEDWIGNLIREFDDSVAAVGGPNLTPGDDSRFGKRTGKVFELLSGVGARYGYSEEEVREIYHNPTCNVMYRKEVLKEVGGFNHNLVTVDDEELDYRIKEKEYRIMYTPHAKVNHYRPSTWGKFAQMAWNYGLGRMQAIKLHGEMGEWFHFFPSLALIILLISLILSFLGLSIWIFSGLLIVGIVGMISAGSYLAIEDENSSNGIKDAFNYSGMVFIWLIGWGLGFIRGVFK